MVNVYKLEYKDVLVGYRFCFEERYFDISLEAIRDEDGENYLLDTYKRLVNKKGVMPVLEMIPASDGLLKTKDELEGKIKVPIEVIDDIDDEDGFENREWLFSMYEGVLNKLREQEDLEDKKVVLNYKDVLDMIKSTIKEHKTVVKYDMWYSENSIKYGDYLYYIDMDILDNKLKYIEFSLSYDIEKYCRASFIEDVEDYDGWYKRIDTSHVDYKNSLEAYNSKRLKLNSSNLYDISEKSYLTLEDKDWLTYVHDIRITLKNPIEITEANIRKLFVELG